MLRSAHNGFETLSLLDGSLRQIRGQLDSLDSNAESASQRLAQLSQDEAGLYGQLARLKIDEIDDAELTVANLNQAERQARDILEQRDKAIAELGEETRRILVALGELEAERTREAELVESAAAALHSQVNETHAHLESQTSYTEAREQAQTAVDQVVAATEKATRTQDEHESKAANYQSDPIFMYLWDRGYGTQSYRANRIGRLVDGWVANHVEFEQARRNYWMLEEIPKRLVAHVDKLQTTADDLMTTVEKIEREAESADGVLDIEDQLEKLRAELAEFDEKISEHEARHNECLSERDSYAAASDTYFKEAVSILAKSFRTYSIVDLQYAARLTEGYEDDTLISQLAELRQHHEALTQEHRAAQQASQSLTSRVHEMERIRRTFKQRRYDAPHSQFSNGGALAATVEDFVRGLISANDLWRTLEHGQRFIRRRSYTNYGVQPGSLRFPRGVRIPSNWGGVGGGGMRMPRRGGGGGSGGFGTGGGF